MFALSLGEMMEQLRVYVNAKVSAATSRLFHFTYYTGNSASGNEDQVVCDNTEESAGSYLVRRMQQFGLRSRPPKGVAAIRLGNYEAASNSVVIASDSDRYGPSDLEDGELAIYCKTSGTEIRLDKDGNIKINAAAGKDVIVNGGSLDVARKTDKTRGDVTMLTWVSAVSTVLNTAGPVVGAPGTVVVPSDFGVIDGGADHFKG